MQENIYFFVHVITEQDVVHETCRALKTSMCSRPLIPSGALGIQMASIGEWTALIASPIQLLILIYFQKVPEATSIFPPPSLSKCIAKTSDLTLPSLIYSKTEICVLGKSRCIDIWSLTNLLWMLPVELQNKQFSKLFTKKLKLDILQIAGFPHGFDKC